MEIKIAKSLGYNFHSSSWLSKEYREAKFKLFGGHIFPRVHNILNTNFRELCRHLDRELEARYEIIENYGQYAGNINSLCMKKNIKS